MGQQFGRVSVRSQLPREPGVRENDSATLSEVIRWAQDFQRAISTTMYDNLQKSLVFTITNTGQQAVASGVTSQAVTFDGRESDTGFQVALTPNWNASLWVPTTSKTVTGFTINASVGPGAGGGTVDWVICR